MSPRRPVFDRYVDRLVAARARLILKKPDVGDWLCQFGFREGLRVETLARAGAFIEYNRDWVKAASPDELATRLQAMATRARTRS